MKMRTIVILALVLMSLAASAQFKPRAGDDSRISESLIQSPSSSFLFGWFDPSRFQMHHSVSFSYMTAGGQGMSLGTYTNSMQYQFSDNLNAQADVSLSYMPTNSFARFGKQDLSNIYLSRAQLNFRPSDNMTIHVQYRALPYNSLSSPWDHPWYRDDGF
jgi:opacity protein-like surface antigen